MSKFSIRRMSLKDLDAVSTIYTLANPQASSETIKKWIEDSLKKFPKFCYVAKVEEKVVGGISGEGRDYDIGAINDLAVAEKYQGRGVGSALLRRVLREFKNAGLKIVILEVHYLCSDSIPFYYKYGFRISGVVQDFFGVGQDIVIMRKELDR